MARRAARAVLPVALVEAVRKQIRQGFDYPCVNDVSTGKCEYKSAGVRVEFGIRRDGTLAFVEVTQSSGLASYDAHAREAVRRAAPHQRPVTTSSSRSSRLMPCRPTRRTR